METLPVNRLLAAFRLAIWLSVTVALMPVQLAAVVLRCRPVYEGLPQAYHRLSCRIMGFDVVVHGVREAGRPVLYAVNHVSYLDIMVLGSLIPGSFVAKTEVAGWPLFGWLAKLQRTLFVERLARGKAGRQRDQAAERLARGDNLILFPEGTSNDGAHTYPFKTALFAAALPRSDSALPPPRVQPVSIAYSHLNGIPLGRELRPLYAWYGDMTLHDHLARVPGLGQARVQVIFHPAIDPRTLSSRKALAAACERVVAEGVAALISGRIGRPSGAAGLARTEPGRPGDMMAGRNSADVAA